MAFIPIPIIIRRQEEPSYYFLTSETQMKWEREERKRSELIEQKKLERKALEKREKIKSKKLKKINKQVSKNGFTVSDFKVMYDRSFRDRYGQELSEKKLKKLKKIYDEMKKYRIFSDDLDIYAQEEKSREQNFELNQAICSNNNKSESSNSLEQLKILRDMLADYSNSQQQQNESILVKTKKTKTL